MLSPLRLSCLLSCLVAACGPNAGLPDSGGGAGGAGGAGASGGGGPSGNPTSGPITLDNYAQLQRMRRCQVLTRCGSYQFEQSCTALYEGATTIRSSDFFGDLVAAGRMVFDASKAPHCLDAWAEISCAEASTPTLAQSVMTACAPMFHGLVAENGSCGYDFECTPDLWCNPDASAREGTCAGRCAPRVGLGAATVHPAACHSGLILQNGVCSAPVALGGACTDSFVCGLDRLCVMGQCAAPGAAGDACSATRRCQSLLACVDGTCAAPLGPGRSCSPSRVGDCKADLRCDAATLSCAERKGPGADCSGTPYGDCALTLRCTPGLDGRGVCQPPGASGARCREGTCGTGLRCDTASSTCAPTFALGAACQTNADCRSGTCAAGTCKSLQIDVCG